MKHVSEHRECSIQEHRKQESLRGVMGVVQLSIRTFDDCDTQSSGSFHIHLVL